MKLNRLFLRIATLSALFGAGITLVVNHNKAPIEVAATPYVGDYYPYYYSGSYYDNIDFDAEGGMNGALRQAITALSIPQGFYTYSGQGETHLATQLQYADEDPNNSNNMVYLYTRDCVTKNSASSWNREHCWPQSLSNGNWGTSEGGTDILHLRPTYPNTNSSRGNTPYGNSGHATTKVFNGMNYGWTGNGYFEPLDCVKGDVARIIMYTWTTYTGYKGYSPLNITTVFQSYDTLLSWHTSDKPDELEGNRNDYVQSSKQKNRNPFVDHPELAWKIFGEQVSDSVKNACMDAYPANGGDPVDPTGITLNRNSASLNVGRTLQLTASLQPSGATGTVSWLSNNPSVASVSNSGLVTANAVGLATITAFIDANSNGSVDNGELNAQCSVTVNAAVATTTISLNYENLTVEGEELTSGNALAVVGCGNEHVTAVSTTKIYNGNGAGGAYPNTGGMLKTGTGSVAGQIVLTLDCNATSVEILCHDFYKKSNDHPTNTNTVSVNGSATQLAPYNETATFDALTFDLATASNEITIDTDKRIFIKNIDITCENANLRYYTVSFNSNGGSAVESQSILQGETVVAPANPTKASDETYDYSFAGWYTNEQCSGDVYDFDTPVTEAFTLYAKWTATLKTAQEVIESSLTTHSTLSYRYTKEGTGTADDTLTRATTGRTGTQYGEWTSASESGISYAGQSAGGNESIQLRTDNNNSGVVVTANTNSYDAHTITITWNSATANSRIVDIYGKNTAYTAATNLYGNTQGTLLGSLAYADATDGVSTLIINNSYKYIGIRSRSGALWLTSIQIHWGEEATFNFSDVAIRYGGKISKTLWDRLDSEQTIQGYGVLLSTDEFLAGDELKDYYDLVDQNWVKDFYRPLTEKPHPDSTLDDQYYVWNLYKRITDENMKTFYTAVAYIKTNSGLVFFNEIAASVKGLAYDLIESGEYDENSLEGSVNYLAHL